MAALVVRLRQRALAVALHESLGFALVGDLVILAHERELWWLRALGEPARESLRGQ